MSGPFEDKGKSETNNPAKSGEVKKPKKRGPKTSGKILMTDNIVRIEGLIAKGSNKTALIAEAMKLAKSEVSAILNRMYKIGMVERVNTSKTNRPEYTYSLDSSFSESGEDWLDPVR